MSKFVSFEIQGATPIDYKNLYDEDLEISLKENESFKYSNIYFFGMVKKRRFVLSETKILKNNNIRLRIVIGGKNINIQDSVFNLISTLKSIPKNIQDTFRIKIDFDNSSDIHIILILNSELFGKEDFEVRISIINIEHSLDIDTKNYPEIVYIGQSFRILERVREHKTLSKAVSRLNDDEELIIYFINFKYGIGEKGKPNMKMGDFMLKTDNRKSKDYKDKISLAERFLIYLFKPTYNDQHIDTELSKDSLVQKILLQSDISMIGLCYAMYGNLYQFWSPNQRLKADLVFYDFDKPDIGFYENGNFI